MELIITLFIATAAVAAVLLPAQRGKDARRPLALDPRTLDDAAIDAAVGRYRAALRAGTVCDRCRFANPVGSRFCADCGRRLRQDPDA